MALYFIGKTQRDIENLTVFAGSETIYGMNENENYATFSLTDEDKGETLTSKKDLLALQDLRFGMEKFKLFDPEAIFVFNDQDLFVRVMNQTTPEMQVTEKDTKVIENLAEFNAQSIN